MKNKKLILDLEEEDCISVGLVRLSKDIPHHELFFKINQQNQFYFSRKKDLLVEYFSGYYNFPIFEAFDESLKNTFIMMANKSINFKRKEGKSIENLFELVEEKCFINDNINFILFSREGNNDFSTIKFPKEWVEVEDYSVNYEEELYQIILNYDE